MKRQSSIGILMSILLIALTGCAGPSKPQKMRLPGPPKQPPAAPPRREVPLDPTLSAAARAEIDHALRSSDALVRTQALEALRGRRDAQADAQIVAALKDSHPGVRFGAAMMAGERKIESARPVLLEMADDPNPNMQMAALFALHKLGDTRRSQDLRHFARDPDPRVRGNLAMVLGLMGEKSAIDKILRPLCIDGDVLVRQQALEAIWRLGDQGALPPLVALTISGYADDKILGALALAAPRRQVVREHIRGLLVDDYVEVTLVAARAMGMLGSDEGFKIAQDGARSKDPQQRFLAALALGAIGRTDAQEELRQLLADSEPNVQLAAASAVLQLNGGAETRVASDGVKSSGS